MRHLPSASLTDRSVLEGRHVLSLLLAFFGVVFAVNGYFLYAALSTHTGVVALEPYRKGLAYNERIAADERQDRLGWVADVRASLGGGVVVSIRDTAGLPIVGLRVTAMIGRPSTERFDRKLELHESGPGEYVAEQRPFLPGGWIALIEIRSSSGTEPIYRMRRRLWLTS